jgi:hypothetical protein
MGGGVLKGEKVGFLLKILIFNAFSRQNVC